MFERYTERARRVLFFARYEASQFGTLTIETEHLLLGIVRESRGLTTRLLQHSDASPDRIREAVSSRMPVFRERIPTSVEMPFGADLKRALGYAAEEADKLGHSYIGTEHLLLALLRDPNTVAGSVLASMGVEYVGVRSRLIELLQQSAASTQRSAVGISVDLSPFVDQMKQLVDQLAQAPNGSPEALALVEQIKRGLDNIRDPFSAI